ncbi:RNA methyltransferase [Actinophytocola xanthii]|uniref:RNA methyltransferase n=1 Tax=Actinophytocola xanthii TaxID=1912961 RepID=A0A1Q8CLI1_9PSEU|nr:RNA methyltransferase [Actinophytocola xanthii]
MARTVRGVEFVVVEEIHDLGLGRVVHVGHREVWFDCPDPGPALLGLRCVDDLFLLAATAEGLGRGRDLRPLAKAAAAVDVPALLALRRHVAGVSQVDTVDVSASFLGRRAFTRYDLEDAVGEPLAAATGLSYRSRRVGVPPPGLSWRVTVADDRAVLALRLARRPLHRRAYRRVTRPGSLHPPLAAAMLRLAGPLEGRRLLDPCCGVGTIPLEAGAAPDALVATDHDPAAVAAARANGLSSAGLADAGRLPVGSGAVDVVVSNPPWNRQVPAGGLLARRPDRFWRELRRVLRPGGRAVLLLPADLRPGLPVLARHPVSLSGRHPEVLVMTRD